MLHTQRVEDSRIQGLTWYAGARIRGREVWGHGGSDPGINTDIRLVPEERVPAIVFINTWGGKSVADHPTPARGGPELLGSVRGRPGPDYRCDERTGFREVAMKIKEILRNKGHDVVTITETRSVLAAAQALVDHNIGGVLVTDGELLKGILTERDILRVTARSPGELDSILVGTVMTRELITAKPRG